MFGIIHDISNCHTNNVTVNEAKDVMSINTWKTARRIVEILYQKRGHEFVAPKSKIGDYMYGEPIHGLNAQLIIRSRDVERITLKNIPESDDFWTQKGELWIKNDDFELNDMFAFKLRKGGISSPNIQNIEGNTQAI